MVDVTSFNVVVEITEDVDDGVVVVIGGGGTTSTLLDIDAVRGYKLGYLLSALHVIDVI